MKNKKAIVFVFCYMIEQLMREKDEYSGNQFFKCLNKFVDNSLKVLTYFVSIQSLR
jgi:hypothetical protein